MSFQRIGDLPGALQDNHWPGSGGLVSVERVLKGKEEQACYYETPSSGSQFARLVLSVENIKHDIDYQNAAYYEECQEIRTLLQNGPNGAYYDDKISTIVAEYLIDTVVEPSVLISEFSKFNTSLDSDFLADLAANKKISIIIYDYCIPSLQAKNEFDERYAKLVKSGDGWAGITKDYEQLKIMLLANESEEDVSKAVQIARNQFSIAEISDVDYEKALERVTRVVSDIQTAITPSYFKNLRKNCEMVHREIYNAKKVPRANAIIIQANKLGYDTKIEFIEAVPDYVGFDCVMTRRTRAGIGGGYVRMPTMNEGRNPDIIFVDRAQITKEVASISITMYLNKAKLAREQFDPKERKPLTLEEQQALESILNFNPPMPMIRPDWEKYINEENPDKIPSAPKAKIAELKAWIKKFPEPPVLDDQSQRYLGVENQDLIPLEVKEKLQAIRQWTAIQDAEIFKQINAKALKPSWQKV